MAAAAGASLLALGFFSAKRATGRIVDAVSVSRVANTDPLGPVLSLVFAYFFLVGTIN